MRPRRPVVLAVMAALVLFAAGPARAADAQPDAAAHDTGLQITYPAEGTLFPPDSVAPTVVWTDDTAGVDRWTVIVRDGTGAEVATATADARRWRPSEED